MGEGGTPRLSPHGPSVGWVDGERGGVVRMARTGTTGRCRFIEGVGRRGLTDSPGVRYWTRRVGRQSARAKESGATPTSRRHLFCGRSTHGPRGPRSMDGGGSTRTAFGFPEGDTARPSRHSRPLEPGLGSWSWGGVLRNAKGQGVLVGDTTNGEGDGRRNVADKKGGGREGGGGGERGRERVATRPGGREGKGGRRRW